MRKSISTPTGLYFFDFDPFARLIVPLDPRGLETICTVADLWECSRARTIIDTRRQIMIFDPLNRRAKQWKITRLYTRLTLFSVARQKAFLKKEPASIQAAIELADLISYSNDFWHAGWRQGQEHVMWEAVILRKHLPNESKEFQKLVEETRNAYLVCGGWWLMIGEVFNFVPANAFAKYHLLKERGVFDFSLQ